MHPWKKHLLPSFFKKHNFSQHELICFLASFAIASPLFSLCFLARVPYTPLSGQLWGAVSPSLFARIPDVSEAFWAPGSKQLRQLSHSSEHFAREPGEQRTDKGSTCLWVWNSLGPWIECKYTLKILLSDTLPASSGLLSWKIFQLRSFSQQKTRI